MSSVPIRVGEHEFQIAVEPLHGGGFTYMVIEVQHGGLAVVKKRHDSALRFETESDAYTGGMMDARRRAAKVGG